MGNVFANIPGAEDKWYGNQQQPKQQMVGTTVGNVNELAKPASRGYEGYPWDLLNRSK
jgi:hypothetical protein